MSSITYEVRVYPDHVEWLLNGKCHRENGPAIAWSGGTQHWLIKGELHREGGPASIVSNGDKYWYRNGKKHREDGPAVEFGAGYPGKYYLYGTYYRTKSAWERAMRDMPLRELYEQVSKKLDKAQSERKATIGQLSGAWFGKEEIYSWIKGELQRILGKDE